jgi:excinuclease ABC subunit A
MVDIIMSLEKKTKIFILAPIARQDKGEFKRELLNVKKNGYQRAIINGIIYDLDILPKIDKNKKNDIEIIVDRISISDDLGNRMADSIETALSISGGIIFIQIVELPIDSNGKYKVDDKITFSEKYSCPVSGFQLDELEPRIFSFNSPFGACPECQGLGKKKIFDVNLIVPFGNISINEGAIAPWQNSTSKLVTQTLESLANHYKFSLDTPFSEYPDPIQDMLFYGSGKEEIEFKYFDGNITNIIKQPFGGIVPSLKEKINKADTNWMKDDLSKYLSESDCEKCNGHRLKPSSLCVKIDGLHIGEVTKKTIIYAYQWFQELSKKLNPKDFKISEKIIHEINQRLEFLMNVGLEYLNISRESTTLSGGESQRIRLASQIGSGLCGVLYVLDEPSIGLHQRDNNRLMATLKSLRDLGNTVIVVEHDDDTMYASDYIIDIGPGAGIHGGEVIACGTVQEIMNNPKSITGQYLNGEKYISIPNKTRRPNNGPFIQLKGARSNNLQNVDIKIPLQTFTVVTGVSGSGKSSLIINTFYKAIMKKLEGSRLECGAYDSIEGLNNIDKVIDIDQSPIGRTPRSNPATYTGVFTNIRDWFTELPESKARGYKVSRFSFNVKGGRCEACQGEGIIKIEMHFLPDVHVECDGCGGTRYNRETLEIKYKNKSISEILTMTVEDSMNFFENVSIIYDKLFTLYKVGLGYIKIGQAATTLSGGEAQRVKLAKELTKRSTGKTLYILDEPTTGLHAHDISKLQTVLHKLVDKGNTVLVIEHNMDVIKTADYVIDIGPEGGDKGGKILISGTPEEVSECLESHTGKFLKPHLERMYQKMKGESIL